MQARKYDGLLRFLKANLFALEQINSFAVNDAFFVPCSFLFIMSLQVLLNGIMVFISFLFFWDDSMVKSLNGLDLLT